MPKNKTNHSIQVIHDLFQIKGGGERLIHTLCHSLNADLLTAHIGSQTFELSNLAGKVTNLDALSSIHGIKTWSLARAFKKHQPHKADYHQVIYSGVAAPLAVHHYSKSRNIFYCHTPPRFVYDKKEHYQKELNFIKKPIFNALINWFKPQYENAVTAMDQVLTNSNYVQQRIKKALDVDATVVYPPCDTNRFKSHGEGGYYLSLARHDSLKRVDVIINAFKQMPDKELVVASGGAETEHLKQAANGCNNIHFTGWLGESELLKLLGNCLATIYIPQDEDFGMSPVESMSAGKPVFCSDHGGLLESVIDGGTGFYIDNQNLEQALIEEISQHSKNHLVSMKSACEQQALTFDTQNFIKNIKKHL